MTTPLSLHIGDLPPMARVRALPHPTHGRKWSSRERAAVSVPKAQVRMLGTSPIASRRKLEMSRREKSIEFKLIFAAAFVVFLFTAALSRLSPARLLAHQDSVAAKSILGEAREAASISAVYAFMG